MVDYQRQLLDSLMGRNRDATAEELEKIKEKSWKDSEMCQFYLYNFCPHELFVNTKQDLGPCQKLHDEKIKTKYEKAVTSTTRKTELELIRKIESDFIFFIQNMVNEVNRKISKGKQRLELMNSNLDQRPVSKLGDDVNEKISKLLREAEDAGTRGDVDQAKNLFELCEKLKEEAQGSSSSETSQEKQMSICSTCGAFLIVGDQQSRRLDDHLLGKLHIGYNKLRKALEDHKKKIATEREKRRSGSSDASSSRKDRRDDRSRRDDSRRDRGSRDRRRDRSREASHRDRHRRRSRSRSVPVKK